LFTLRSATRLVRILYPEDEFAPVLFRKNVVEEGDVPGTHVWVTGRGWGNSNADRLCHFVLLPGELGLCFREHHYAAQSAWQRSFHGGPQILRRSLFATQLERGLAHAKPAPNYVLQ